MIFHVPTIALGSIAAARSFAAIGSGAAYLTLVVHASFALRRRLGTKTWRRVHYLSFVAFIAATLHAVWAGTDSAHPWIVAVYALPLVAVGALVVYRVMARFVPHRA